MSSERLCRTLLTLTAVSCLALRNDPAAAGSCYGLGTTATEAQISALDIDVRPDGQGLPLGRGSVEQGATLFAQVCASCHGARGQGGPAERLVGGIGTLATPQPVKTVGSYWPYATTLFDYVRRAMPYDKPNSLTADQVYALVAYVLEMNGIVAAGTTLDAATLPKVEMPNRHGFIVSTPAPEASSSAPRERTTPVVPRS
jgi:cytochrome c